MRRWRGRPSRRERGAEHRFKKVGFLSLLYCRFVLPEKEKPRVTS